MLRPVVLVVVSAVTFMSGAACVFLPDDDVGEGEGEGEAAEGEGEVGEGEGEANVVINEVACRGDDFVEVMNVGGAAAVLPVAITDDVLDPSRRASVPVPLAAGARVVVSLGDAGFGLACDEDVALLVDERVVDAVRADDGFEATATRGRVPDGTGPVVNTEPTPGAANVAWVDRSGEPFNVDGGPVRLELQVPPDSEASLRVDGYTYVEGSLVVVTPSGATPPVTVGLRKKGRVGSFRDYSQKMAWKIDIDRFVDGQRVLGLARFNLNNLVQDPSAVHEWMAYRVFATQGVPVPLVNWVDLVVNGESWGPYLMIESADDDAVARRAGIEPVAVFEGEYGEDLFSGYAPNFDLDAGPESARVELERLIDLLNNAPAESVLEALEPILDWDEVLAEMATEIVIGHWDGYAPTRNNYFLLLGDDGRFRVVPWGVDQTFDYPWPLFDGQGLILQRCLGDSDCRVLWEAALASVVDGAEGLLDGGFADETRARATALVPRFADDPRREWDHNNIPPLADGALAFLQRRIDEVRDTVGCLRDPTADVDGDGYQCGLDCAEGDPNTHTNAVEICSDGLDQDCNGRIDDGFDCPDCILDDRAGRPAWFCRNPRTYFEAVNQCASLGARLVSLRDVDEAIAFYELARGYFGDGQWWLALDDIATEGTFVWGDGRAWQPGSVDVFALWAPGEPNDAGGNEDCGHVWGFSPEWNDIPCDVGMAAVCEPVPTIDPSPPPGP
jgi:hypothetical protein